VADLDADLHYDFSGFVTAPQPVLLELLAECHTALANLAARVAFLRQEELRGAEHAKVERIGTEGLMAVYTEQKWLIKTLLEERRHGVDGAGLA
jgi:hypothetical protein